jgi:hypothetical protein
VDPSPFDTIARLVAARRLSRRAALRQGRAGLAAAGLAAAGLAASTRDGAAAQDATPASGSAKAPTDPTFLFVQSFESGTFAPVAGSPGSFTLTLARGLGQTVYFSDRPERVFGSAPTAAFLKGMPFGPDNPPNAALVLEAAPSDTDVVVMELTNPVYDEATKTATYDAKVLADYQKLGVTFQEEPKGPAEVHAEFGAASLFIDDCPDLTTCYTAGLVPAGPLPGGPIGACWRNFACVPCNGESIHDLEVLCNNTYPQQCVDICVVY